MGRSEINQLIRDSIVFFGKTSFTFHHGHSGDPMSGKADMIPAVK